MTEPRPEYRKTKTAALQQLAAGGDVSARRELERRGEAMTSVEDVTRLDDAALRQLVRRWRDGTMPAERAHHRALAERAYAELQVRYRVDARLAVSGRRPVPPSPAPWQMPRRDRCRDWERPAGSTLYPEEEWQQRERFAPARAAGVPREEDR